MDTKIAGWASKTGKHWVELFHDGVAASYSANSCGGCFGVMTKVEAIKLMQSMVNSKRFLPDSAKTPMRRTLEETG